MKPRDDHPAVPTRRRVLQLAAVAAVGALGLSPPSRRATGNASLALDQLLPDLRQLESTFAEQALGWLQSGQLVRDDGWIYAIDVGLLAIYFAKAGDPAKFKTVRDFAVDHLVMNEPADPAVHRLVQWRMKPGPERHLDATGTTESLRLAKALWLGAHHYDRPGDADFAVDVLHGYGRHEGTDQGVWMIRNYYSLNTRGYATNSFLVDYDPDFVQTVADARNDEFLRKIARNSYDVVTKAVTPCGLIYDLIQPELKTLVPEMDLAVFSPNDVCGLANCATVALTVTRGLPAVAGGVLRFAARRAGDLRKYYYGRTGEPADDKLARSYEWATLTRLAAQLGAAPELAQFVQHGLPQWRLLARYANAKSAYAVSEVLLAIRSTLEVAENRRG